MASVKKKQRKNGSFFYEISVSRGYSKSPYTMRWDIPEGLGYWSPATNGYKYLDTNDTKLKTLVDTLSVDIIDYSIEVLESPKVLILPTRATSVFTSETAKRNRTLKLPTM